MDRKKHQYTADTLKDMKTQDINYLTSRLMMENKKLEKLQANLQGLGGKAQNKHAIFLDNPEDVTGFNAAEYFDTAPELVERTFNRPKLEQLESGNILTSNVTPRVIGRLEDKRKRKYNEIMARRKRKSELTAVHDKLSLQKKLLGKGRRTKVVVKDIFGDEDKEKTHFKWKMERKR